MPGRTSLNIIPINFLLASKFSIFTYAILYLLVNPMVDNDHMGNDLV